MYLSYCAECGRKKLRFFKEQKARGLLSNLGMKVLILSKISIMKVICFKGIKWMI